MSKVYILRETLINPVRKPKGSDFKIEVKERKGRCKMKRTVLFYLADGRAEWNFGDVRMTIRAPWVSWSMYLIYEHTPEPKKGL
jgi:hypothetical protein